MHNAKLRRTEVDIKKYPILCKRAMNLKIWCSLSHEMQELTHVCKPEPETKRDLTNLSLNCKNFQINFLIFTSKQVYQIIGHKILQKLFAGKRRRTLNLIASSALCFMRQLGHKKNKKKRTMEIFIYSQ